VIGKHDKHDHPDHEHEGTGGEGLDERRTAAVRVETDAVERRSVTGDPDLGAGPVSGLGEARRRFGGFDLLAALAGMLAALGAAVLLAGLAAAAGSVGYSRGAEAEDLSNGGLVTGIAVLLVAFFVGGWVAGRMARYDGVLNGASTAVLFVLLAAGLSAVGAWLDNRYDFLDEVNLPQWFTGTSDGAAIASAVLGILAMVLAATLGGAVGARYHRRADAVIVGGPEAAAVHGGSTDTLERSELMGRRAVR